MKNPQKCSSKNVFVRLFFDPPNFQFSAADILHSSRATRRKRDGRPLTEHQSSSRTLVFSHFETSRFFARREPSRRKNSPSSSFFCRGPRWRTPPRGGAPRQGWRTPQGVAHPVRGAAPRKGWRTPEGVPPLVPACVKPRQSSSGTKPPPRPTRSWAALWRPLFLQGPEPDSDL